MTLPERPRQKEKLSYFPLASTFTAIGLLLSAGAIYATYDVFRKTHIKNLTIEIYNTTPLVSVLPEASSDIIVNYKGKPVGNLSLIQISVKNSGGQPIKPEDYIEPVTFIFPETFEIAEASVSSSTPSNLGMSVEKITPNAAILANTLLNQKDQFDLAFILISEDSGSTASMSVDGRIVGVKAIEYKTRENGSEGSAWSMIQSAIFGVILATLVSILNGELQSGFSHFLEKLRKDS